MGSKLTTCWVEWIVVLEVTAGSLLEITGTNVIALVARTIDPVRLGVAPSQEVVPLTTMKLKLPSSSSDEAVAEFPVGASVTVTYAC